MTMTMMTKSRGGRGVKKRLEGQEEEEAQDGKEEERGGEGRFMVAVMQKCKHFATFAENNDTAGRGRCARSVFLLCVCCVCVCVCVCTCSCVGGCSNSTTGSGRRTTEVKWEREREREREPTPAKLEIWDFYHKRMLHKRQNKMQHFELKTTSCFNNHDQSVKPLHKRSSLDLDVFKSFTGGATAVPCGVSVATVQTKTIVGLPDWPLTFQSQHSKKWTWESQFDPETLILELWKAVKLFCFWST